MAVSPRSVGEAIATLRRDRGLSQELLADRAGVHRTYVGGIERGERNPTVISLGRIADALGVPLSELFVAGEALEGGRRRPR